MATWNDIQDFPEGIGITDVSITAENAVGVREQPYSFRQEVQVFAGQRLRMRVNFKRHDSETGSRLESFLLKLRGTAGRFRFFDPYHSLPAGQNMGLPTVVSGLAGSQSVETQGWIPAVNCQLKSGDYIQLGDYLHRVLDDVHSDAQGRATLTVWPDLRVTHETGTEVKTYNPTGVWRLARDPNFDRQVIGQKHLTSMECVEAL